MSWPRPHSGRPHSDRVRAELQLPFPLDELPESWIEVVQDKLWPVRSAKGHRIRRALRWADAALRAERAPAGLAPHAAHEDWAALAATAWERCRRDWEAAGRRRPCRPGRPAPGRSAVADRRSRLPGRDPRPLAQERGPRDVTAALGPTAQAAIQAPAAGSSITTSTRRLAPEAPGPTTSLAP